MNLANIINGPLGIVHVIASVLAMATGLYVLVNTKGTQQHRKIGYIYSGSMTILNLTALLIYKLFGSFGIFHWFAIISLLTLIAGLYPIITKRGENYIIRHFSFMYWSVIGLYCAFVAEIFTRLPKIILNKTGRPQQIFFVMVGIGIAITMTVGAVLFIKFKQNWVKQFERNT